jgi:hypothetical protein
MESKGEYRFTGYRTVDLIRRDYVWGPVIDHTCASLHIVKDPTERLLQS